MILLMISDGNVEKPGVSGRDTQERSYENQSGVRVTWQTKSQRDQVKWAHRDVILGYRTSSDQMQLRPMVLGTLCLAAIAGQDATHMQVLGSAKGSRITVRHTAKPTRGTTTVRRREAMVGSTAARIGE